MLDTIEFLRHLLEQQPSSLELQCSLAEELLREAHYDAAITMATVAIEQDAAVVAAWLTRATAYKKLARWAEAVHDYTQAARLAPARSSIMVNAASCLAELDRLEEAENWLRRAVALDPRSKEAQANLGSILVRLDRLLEAESPCLAALAIDKSLLSPRQNLSVILADSDPVAARHHRDVAYLSKQVFVERAVKERCRVLVLTAADAANIPLQHLLKRDSYTTIRWYIEYATSGQAQTLPAYDLVFNSIGDPDFIPKLSSEVNSFLQNLGNHLLNRFEWVERTSRQALPALLEGLPHTRVPAVLRSEQSGAVLADDVRASGLSLPVLMRPVGSHGGKGVQRVNHLHEFADPAMSACYVTEFVDFRSQDGWYRKYRVIYVDGKAFPYHLAISSDWLVHYWTSGMETDSNRRAEEARFLDNPAGAIGTKAWSAVVAIGQRLNLDFGGIDFSVLADGTVLVFEANATMLVHPEADPLFSYRANAVAAIQAAFHRMIENRCSTESPCG